MLNGGVPAMEGGGVVPGVIVWGAAGGVAEGSARGLGVGVCLLEGPTADLAWGVTKAPARVGVMGVDAELTCRCTTGYFSIASVLIRIHMSFSSYHDHHADITYSTCRHML